ncbi:PQQ-dependent sugar dehydrogenase [Microbaculum marinisediminis]|uniref:PQQ-dependent sugar dehydrogenase n=1 Tax=Microbaculum marinisediminis TaxID=2931392 RepID=A0AAW5QYQ3_9HYPH|nr:PQQ-dependent sugar dehydrogenase [Microbaculum sp. A6E488]MCT8972145.1 PQQ-dependent sugar dehydrogenase [Microbaculum sp. A6E488]
MRGESTLPERSRPSRLSESAVALLFAALLGAGGAPAAAQTLKAVPVGAFDAPVHVAVAPGYRKLVFVVERAGRIRVLRNGQTLARPFLDIRKHVFGPPDSGAGGEQGLLSVAFPASYRNSRRFYVAYTNGKGDLVVAEFRRKKKRAVRASRKSRRVVLRVPHRDARNHNGGQLQFGPDGRLYIATGDGGGGGDGFDNARKLDRLLGKILRINPRQTRTGAYRIPKSNPFVGTPGRDEIFAYGLRNPWRFAFDGNRLLIGDVGQGAWEEVNILTLAEARGANFGWPQYEGNAVYDNDRPGPDTPTFPVFVYDHSGGRCSITGGHIVRDPAIPAMTGRYVYGDFCSGEVRSIAADGTDDQPTGIGLPGLSSFGLGVDGQIYAAQLGGTVSRIAAATASAPR